jgi:hypothetical protein
LDLLEGLGNEEAKQNQDLIPQELIDQIENGLPEAAA